MWVKPVAGQLVRDPRTKRPLDADVPTFVEDGDVAFGQLLNHGDVVLSDAPPPEAEAEPDPEPEVAAASPAKAAKAASATADAAPVVDPAAATAAGGAQ